MEELRLFQHRLSLKLVLISLWQGQPVLVTNLKKLQTEYSGFKGGHEVSEDVCGPDSGPVIARPRKGPRQSTLNITNGLLPHGYAIPRNDDYYVISITSHFKFIRSGLTP